MLTWYGLYDRFVLPTKFISLLSPSDLELVVVTDSTTTDTKIVFYPPSKHASYLKRVQDMEALKPKQVDNISSAIEAGDWLALKRMSKKQRRKL